MATCIAGGPIAGHFIDVWLDTEPWFAISGLVLGLVIGFYGAWRTLTTTLAQMKRWDAAEQRRKKK